jgi:hypothetical protein
MLKVLQIYAGRIKMTAGRGFPTPGSEEHPMILLHVVLLSIVLVFIIYVGSLFPLFVFYF